MAIPLVYLFDIALTVCGLVFAIRSVAALDQRNKAACLVWTVILLLTACASQVFAQDASASAGSGFWSSRKDTATGAATWRIFTPTPLSLDTITWTSGINHADGAAFPKITYGPEPKFGFGGSVPFGHVFAGFSRTDVGPCGSKAITMGEGNSSLAVSLFGFLPSYYRADWSVTATGSLGSAPCPQTIEWDSQTTGNDPFSITPAQLAAVDATEPFYDVYFEAELSTGSYSSAGGMGMNVSYLTGSGSLNLLNISLDGVELK